MFLSLCESHCNVWLAWDHLPLADHETSSLLDHQVSLAGEFTTTWQVERLPSTCVLLVLRSFARWLHHLVRMLSLIMQSFQTWWTYIPVVACVVVVKCLWTVFSRSTCRMDDQVCLELQKNSSSLWSWLIVVLYPLWLRSYPWMAASG